MFAKLIQGYWTREYVSISGKLWVGESPYDFTLDEYLHEDEELYVSNNVATYTKKFENSQIIIENVVPAAVFNNPFEFINALRYIASMIHKAFPDAEGIRINNEEIVMVKNGRTTNIRCAFKKDDGRINRPKVFSFTEEIPEQYSQFLKSRTSVRTAIYDKKLIAFGKYFIYYEGPYAVVGDIDKVLAESDPIYYLYNIDVIPIISVSRSVTIKEGPKFISYSMGETLFTSPPSVPANAFLMNMEGTYIQFTKNGVLLTKGIFFAKEELAEVDHPQYIVEKTDDGWDIYVAVGNSSIDGHYVIKDGKLYRFPLRNRDIINIIPGDPIYVSSIYVWKDGEHLMDNMGSKRKIDDFWKRYKVSVGQKTIYVPKHILDECIFSRL